MKLNKKLLATGILSATLFAGNAFWRGFRTGSGQAR